MQFVYQGHPGVAVPTNNLNLRRHHVSRIQGILLSTTLLTNAGMQMRRGRVDQLSSSLFVFMFLGLFIWCIFQALTIGFTPAVVVADPVLVRS